MLTGVEDAPNYFNQIAVTPLLHDYYPQKPRMCYCNFPAVLRMSKSEKNPGRLYFKCRQPTQCEFFQWGDELPQGRKRAWIEFGTKPRFHPYRV